MGWGLLPRRAASVSPDGRYVAWLSAPRLLGALAGMQVATGVDDRHSRKSTVLSTGDQGVLSDPVYRPSRVVWAPDSKGFAGMWMEESEALGRDVAALSEWVTGPLGWSLVAEPLRQGDVLASALAASGPARERALEVCRELCYGAGAPDGHNSSYRTVLGACDRLRDGADAAEWLHGQPWKLPCGPAWLPPFDRASRAHSDAMAWAAWDASRLFLCIAIQVDAAALGPGEQTARPGEVHVAIGAPGRDERLVEFVLRSGRGADGRAGMRAPGLGWGAMDETVRWSVRSVDPGGSAGTGGMAEAATYALIVPWSVLRMSREPREGDVIPFGLTAEYGAGPDAAPHIWFQDLRGTQLDQLTGRLILLVPPGHRDV